jgi:NtrC-family two-component system response regulator AlgB
MDFLIIDDDRIFREATCLLIEDEGHYAEGAANSDVALEALKLGKFDAVFLDVNLGATNGLQFLPVILKLRPTQSVVMFSAQGTIKNAVQAIQHGAVDFLEKPFTREQFLAVLARLRRFNELGKKIEKLEEEVKETRAEQPDTLVDFETPAMKHVMDVLQRAAKSPASVLILGESGTGKELVARSVHFSSPRKERPFVPVDCSSLTPTLIESELFGYVKGAFTGALQSKQGLLESAQGGTLFLDEIGDMPIDMQAKLLRALQEQEIKPVGSTERKRINVRIIAATNRDLEAAIRSGAFRQDLYFRLNVVQIKLPPLRDRKNDVPLLVTSFLEKLSPPEAPPRTISEDAMLRLMAYDWPGNVRELENAVARAVALGSGPIVHVGDLPSNLQYPTSERAPERDELLPLDELERRAIMRMLRETKGDKLAAARLLGIGKTTLYRKLKQYHMEQHPPVENHNARATAG